MTLREDLSMQLAGLFYPGDQPNFHREADILLEAGPVARPDGRPSRRFAQEVGNWVDWAPRRFCPSGCGCQPGQADMRDCGCDGPCVWDDEWRGDE